MKVRPHLIGAMAALSLGVTDIAYVCAAQLNLSQRQVEEWIDAAGRADRSMQFPSDRVSKNDPDYPTLATLIALNEDQSKASAKVIEALEPMLQQTEFLGLSKGTSLWVGAVGAFDLWRETAYLLLGRAYYETGNDDLAVRYLQGIPKESLWYRVARLELGWALLRKQDWAAAEKNLGEMKNAIESADNADPSAGDDRQEWMLQQACLAVGRKEAERAMEWVQKAGTPTQAGGRSALVVLRAKVLAEAKFQIYLKSAPQLDAAGKKSILKEILQVVETVPPQERDSVFSFLAGESYWHYASVLRIEQPEKYKTQWIAALQKANSWLGPWADRAVSQSRAILSEDALFFSVAVLWEQELYDEAIPRLRAIARLFPQGEYREDSYQLLADYYYDRGEFSDAIHYYGELAKTGNDEKAAYGVYKAAWSFYNQQEKWKALRHLERLVLHYRDKGLKAQSLADDAESKGSLLKESEKDMFLMIAELLGYRQAIQELELFKYSADEKVSVRETLARTYKQIGKYDDSIAVWQVLLQEQKGTVKSYSWLGELLDTLLASGKRQSIGPMLSLYFGDLPKPGGDAIQKAYDDLEKAAVRLTLTIHKEANKTDDADIWKAVDLLYVHFLKCFQASRDGDFWYFGAQRQEKLGRMWNAVEWYQKAAQTQGYANREDAGLTVLRIVKDLSDQYEENPEKAKAQDHLRLSEAAAWYVTQYPKRSERTAAEYLVLDGFYRARALPRAREALVQMIQADGPTQAHQNQYLMHNQRLYKDKSWEEAHELAGAVAALDSVRKNAAAKAFFTQLSKFGQETAFQAAFALEKDPLAKGRAREWYRKAIEFSADDEVALKAWHNAILSHEIKSESRALVEWVDRFKMEERLLSRKDADSKKLLFAVFSREAQAWAQMGEPSRKAAALRRAASVTPSEELYWNVALTYGGYNDAAGLKETLLEMKSRKMAILSNPENRIAYARLLFWNGEAQVAWNEVRSILSEQRSPPANAWILFRDLYAFSAGESGLPGGASADGLYRQIREYILKNRQALTKNTFLQPLWMRLLHPDFDSKEVAGWMELDERAPAANAPKNDSPLAVRVQAVSKVLKELAFNQGRLRGLISDPIPQVTVTVACAAPALGMEAVRRLDRLRAPAVESPQWPAFLSKLDSKIQELKTLAKKEEKICEEQREQLAYLPRRDGQASAICGREVCFSFKAPSSSEIASLEQKNGSLSSLDRVRALLEAGAWARAELLAYETTSLQERSLLLGLIRLSAGDGWNAAPLLKEAEKDPKLAMQAKVLLGRIAWRNGHRRVASEEIKGISAARLSGWLQELLLEMKPTSAQ